MDKERELESPPEPSWQTKRRHTFMVVFSLIATMAYQVGVNPPGGVWLDDAKDHKVGKAILAYNYPDLYPVFMCFNTVGFLLSLTTILVLIISLPRRGLALTLLQAFISWCMFLTTAFSYTFCVLAISPTGEKYVYDRDASEAIRLLAIMWGCMMFVIFIGHLLELTIGIPKCREKLNGWLASLQKPVRREGLNV